VHPWGVDHPDRPTRCAPDRRPALAGLTLALAVAAAGCGGAGGPSADADDIGLGARPSAAEPAATDADAVRPYLDALVERHAEVVSAVSGDPMRVDAADAPLAADYLALFEPGSEAAEAVVAGWVETADDGITMAPFEPDAPIFSMRTVGDLTATSDDEVRFAVCAEERSLTYDHDRLVARVPYSTSPGEAVAVRVDGRWLLRRLAVSPDTTACEGAA
jgi:hypothetical protein